MAENKIMKTLTFGDVTYEVVDEKAREELNTKGAPNGIAMLDEDGKISSEQLPEIKSYGSDGENSFVTNDTAVAIGSYSFASGEDNVAGVKAFVVQAIDETTITLDSVEGLEVNDVLSYKYSASYINFSTVTAVDAINLTVTVNAVPSFTEDDYASSRRFLFVTQKPTIGTTSFDSGQHTEGADNKALLYAAHAEGYNNISADRYSHTENRDNVAYYAAHAEGMGTSALGSQSHSEGAYTRAEGANSHAEGQSTIANGIGSHAEGYDTKAAGAYSHAEGYSTFVLGCYAHAEGNGSEAIGDYAHAEGRGTHAIGNHSHASGFNTYAEGSESHTEGYGTHAIGTHSHAEGHACHAEGNQSHAEGNGTYAIGARSHAEGNGTRAEMAESHAEGYQTIASGGISHAEGHSTKASGGNSHSEGYLTEANGYCSHAQGRNTHAIGDYSHVEGYNSFAGAKYFTIIEKDGFDKSGGYYKLDSVAGISEGDIFITDAGTTNTVSFIAEENSIAAYPFSSTATKLWIPAKPTIGTQLLSSLASSSHAEGQSTTCIYNGGHSEGIQTYCGAVGGHTEGYKTRCVGEYSHAEGQGTIARWWAQHVQGKYNLLQMDEDYLHIVGNGTGESDVSRSNAHTINWRGDATFAGSISSNSGSDYAEYFEWEDKNTNNEDRVGLDGEKIKLANNDDDILGIITGTATVIGDNAEWGWKKKYLTDDFGRIIYEDVEEFIQIPTEELDEDGNPIIEKKSLGVFKHPILNPDYNAEQTYVNRANRPEWDTVGMLGKLHVRDDGTCEVNGYATVGENGIATKSDEKTNMRVLSRVNEHVVRVLLK